MRTIRRVSQEGNIRHPSGSSYASKEIVTAAGSEKSTLKIMLWRMKSLAELATQETFLSPPHPPAFQITHLYLLPQLTPAPNHTRELVSHNWQRGRGYFVQKISPFKIIAQARICQ